SSPALHLMNFPRSALMLPFRASLKITAVLKPLGLRHKTSSLRVQSDTFPTDAFTNVSQGIIEKTTRKLHLVPNHPINILKKQIESHLATKGPYKVLDSMNPVVTTQQNFDSLLIPADHPGRQPTDTYYINRDLVLRTHTSAHQAEALQSNDSDAYILSADVYRRDEVDPTHYPVFHQMEGIRLFSRQELAEMANSLAPEDVLDPGSESNPVQSVHHAREASAVAKHLKQELEGLIRALFNNKDLQVRWIEAYFPFTSPRQEREANL
ncbi:hypothetical protein HDU91_006500, partial [Kappamyces sp. JEL0680]